MKARILIPAVLLPAAALLWWRVELDRAFLPARLQNDMTVRPAYPPQAHIPGSVPFAPPRPPAPAALLYRQHCAACHGTDGHTPPYLANYPGMPQITHLRRAPLDTATWTDSITRGRGAMPAYAHLLSPEQIQALVQHIPTLEQSPHTGPVSPTGIPARIQETPHSPEPPTPQYGRALLAFLLSLPLGWFFQRGLITPRPFERQVAYTLGSAAVGTATGIALWGSAAFTLPALAFAAGLACHALISRGQIEPRYPALQTTALAVAAYASAIPLLVGSYLPGANLPGSYLAGHAACLGVLVLLALIPLRTPRAVIGHALAVLLTLACAHMLLSCHM